MKSLVIVLQAGSVRWLGPYGNEWIATPSLDRLAAAGVVFDRHYSDNPMPHATRHAWVNQPAWQHWHSQGITTALVRASRPQHDGHPDYYARWDKVFDARPDAADVSPNTALIRRLPQILDELQSHNSYTLWLELDTLLPPWDVPEDVFAVYIEDLLDEAAADTDAANTHTADELAEPLIPWADPQVGWFDTDDIEAEELLHRSVATAVTAFDVDLGRILDQLPPEMAVVFTGERGFALGEHGMIGPHRPWLHEEVVHVPLIVRMPHAAHAGLRISRFTQPPDVVSLVQEIHGLGTSPIWAGRDVAMSESVGPLAAERAIRTEDWTLLVPTVPHPEDDDEPRTPKLYQRPDDINEVNDLALREAEVVEELTQRLTTPNPEG